jgi:ribosomal 30S subunit maturation factor RimM
MTALARELVGLALVDDSDHDIGAIVRLYRPARADPPDR